MGKMETYGGDSKRIQGEMAEKVKTAKEMRDEIEDLKSTMGEVPDGLDDSVASAIQAATDESRRVATDEITRVSDSLSEQQQQAETLTGEVNELIGRNEQAVHTMEGVRGNKFATGIDSAISEAKQNSKFGEDVVTELQRKAEEAMRDAENATHGI